MTKSEILRDEILLRVFERFDTGRCGCIKFDDFCLIFENFNLQLTRQECAQLFIAADKDRSGDLNFAEFKDFSCGDKTNEIYKPLLKRVREQQERIFGAGKVKTYLPFCLTKLVENLSFQGQRDMICDDLERLRTENPQQNIKNFLKLFMIASEQTDSKCVSDAYQQTALGKVVAEEVNYGSPVCQPELYDQGPAETIQPLMLDFPRLQMQTYKDNDFLERKATDLVSQWRVESKQEDRQKQMLMFRKSSQEPPIGGICEDDEEHDPYMMHRKSASQLQQVRRSIQAEPLQKLIERAKQRGREKAHEELVAAGREIIESSNALQVSKKRRGSLTDDIGSAGSSQNQFSSKLSLS